MKHCLPQYVKCAVLLGTIHSSHGTSTYRHREIGIQMTVIIEVRVY